MNKSKRISLSPLSEYLKKVTIIILTIFVFIFSMNQLNLDFVRFISRLERVPIVMSHFLAFDTSIIFYGITQLLISIMMAISALFLGGIISLMLAFLAADSIAPNKIVAIIIKGGVAIIRAIPNLVLILIIVASLGLGSIAAITSLTLSTMGYLTKAFISSIEEQPDEIIDALRSTGASWMQIVIHGLLPNIYSSFLAWISIRLEFSISDSIILGIVGAGGIGTMLARSIRNQRHAEVTTLLLIIYISVLLIEYFITKIKKKELSR